MSGTKVFYLLLHPGAEVRTGLFLLSHSAPTGFPTIMASSCRETDHSLVPCVLCKTPLPHLTRNMCANPRDLITEKLCFIRYVY